MPLVIGAHLGPYEIIAPLGSGGMGEVYRARDPRLGREVAIKVSAERFSDRFAREARAVAALNHPNICTLHDIGPDYLVMELVDGMTLEERLGHRLGPNASGSSESSATGQKPAAPLSLEEALRVAHQIADALESAHARGIVHRDLKPANIKIRPDGTVKVLDFGLATLDAGGTEGVGAKGAGLSHSPTMMASMPGMIVGTAAYMAPEQARGAAVDKRADNWAFGVVLFEMLTGRPLFARPTLADTIAAVLHDEPNWSQVPARARRLVRSCLQRDPQRRLHDIADARLLIDDEMPEAVPVPRSRLGWAVAAACALLAVGAVWAPWRTLPPAAEPVRFEIAPNVNLAASGASAISPNGRHLAFIGSGPDGVLRVWVRDMDSLVDRPLPGSEVGQAAPPPFWSPDSRFIAFDAGGKLKKVDVSGGLAQTVCDVPSAAVGGSWNRDGVIIFGNVSGGIMRVSEAGGTPSQITVVDPSRSELFHLTPVFLPDGRRFLYLRTFPSMPERTGIFVGSLDAKPDEQDGRRLLATSTSFIYVPAADGPGKLLFLRDGNLMAQAFDDRRLELSGVPALVAERVDAYRDTATVSASHNGVLVYRGAADLQLTWVERQGRVVGRVREPGLYQSLNLSSDGARAVVSKVSSQVSSNANLWLFDFARETSTRFTTADADDAVWSPDGSRIVFSSGSELRGLLYQKLTSGTQRQDVLYKSGEDRLSPTSWSRDGRFLMYTAINPKTSSDLWVLSLDGQPKAEPFLRTDSAESQAQFSPSPQRGPLWVAYTSNESGRNEVVVRTFPDAGNQQVVSRSGGHSPRWRGDGRELFYVAADGTVMAVAVANGPTRVGPPTPLFQAPRGFASRDATGSRAAAPWDVMPDGQRFLFAAPAEASGLTHFTVVLNWQAGLTK